MAEPQIVCPKCNYEIPLTESLAAPLLEAARRDFREQLAAKEGEFKRKADELRRQQEELTRAKETIEEQVSQRLQAERSRISAAEAKKAQEAVAADLQTSRVRLAELQEILRQNDMKLAEAQKAQAELLRKQRELDDEKREMELTIEKRVQATQADIVLKARQEAEDSLKSQVSQKDAQIVSMARTIEELRRKAEQGSQQTQGEAFELELESLLKSRFPLDLIEPVCKGEFGGDIVQKVNGQMGAPAGVILWELKQTKNWVDGWLSKLREDQRTAKADMALIISQALPKDVDSFDLIDGVWVAHPRCAIPVSIALRHALIELATTRNSQVGQQGKMERIYTYLTGPRFRLRVEGIVEKFGELKEDLEKERKFMNRSWAKREAQIQGVLESTFGMYGDLQGIAGKALPEIPSLDLPLLEGPES
ncbi:DUF2130 domain-containing protein [Bradyrhizobium sp.]|uniref:DUF2130 domain-containing protein n=1 Tax=Bradyrhizobium sp. TaxID=376 RepID=UPI001D5CA292|nr:DUF2130 domain-containing protein [Bradyrhizobium sp.]MBI5322898.1 DUF2130 domain-containing protein [Bradyrhizobium sp.]